MITSEKWSILALLRFFLASIVAINHLAEYTQLGLLSIIPKLGAFEAILGFLLISGYSVTASYLNRPDGFLLRRLKRLYPVYFASLMITLIVLVFVQKEVFPNPFIILVNALFLNQILTTTSFVGPAWSLSLEFWLYCSLPFLYTLSPRVNRFIIYISLISYVIYTALRTLLHLPYYSNIGYGGNLLFLCFAWVCGSQLAREDTKKSVVLKDLRVIFIIHIFIKALIQLGSSIKRGTIEQFFYIDIFNYFMHAVTLWVVYTIFKIFILDDHVSTKKSRLMQTLGDISYPLYLIHIPIYMVVSKIGIKSPIAFYLFSLAASYLLYMFVDFYSQRRGKLKISNTERSS